MEFKKFPSLNNTYNQKDIERIMSHPCASGAWLVTEKLHGANFSFWYDNISGPRIASRTQFVDKGFYGCGEVFDRHVAKFVSYCNEHFPNKSVVVYGELFGGNIQREVKYAEKAFAAFELVVDGVPFEKFEALKVFKGMGFSVPKLIYAGTLEKALEISPEFKSYNADPNAEPHLQLSEGLVIEPVVPSWTGNGSRVYFKHKSKSFQEKKDCTPKESKKPATVSSPEAQNALDLLTCRVTKQRANNVLSKLGVLSEKEFGKLLGAYTQDLIEEVNREEFDDVQDVKDYAGDEWKTVTTILKREMMPVLREAFIEQLETKE